jgi:hypothetical protein
MGRVAEVWLGRYMRMTKKRFQTGVVMKRFPVSFLSEVVYFTQPISRELAETIRALRRDHGLAYDAVMWALSESDPDMGQCYTFGKALTERTVLELKDDDKSWK